MNIKKIVIAGSGTMGSGIAQVCAQSNFQTILFDLNQESIERAKLMIEKNLNKAVEIGKLSEEKKQKTISNISYTSETKDLIGDLILEAIPENLKIKQDFFRSITEQNKPDTIFATNTSSIPISQIAAGIVNPGRVIGIHFFNPAHIMKLVEIIEGEETNPEVTKTVEEWVNTIGKSGVKAKDAPGFIVNRVARHFYVESLKILEEQVTDFNTIDKLMEASGFKMGPFRLMDLIGVDTNYSVTQSMFELFNYEARFRPNRIQKQKVIAGKHGKKTGKGFYDYE